MLYYGKGNAALDWKVGCCPGEKERLIVPFGFHLPELIIIFAILALIFGAKRLPEMGSAVGKTIREFQKSMREVGDSSHGAPETLPPAARPTEAQQITGPSATTRAETAHPTAEAVTGEPIQQ